MTHLNVLLKVKFEKRKRHDFVTLSDFFGKSNGKGSSDSSVF